jgi:hypothetical protein
LVAVVAVVAYLLPILLILKVTPQSLWVGQAEVQEVPTPMVLLVAYHQLELLIINFIVSMAVVVEIAVHYQLEQAVLVVAVVNPPCILAAEVLPTPTQIMVVAAAVQAVMVLAAQVQAVLILLEAALVYLQYTALLVLADMAEQMLNLMAAAVQAMAVQAADKGPHMHNMHKPAAQEE